MCLEANVEGTRQLVRAVERHAPDALVVAVSSSNVYGSENRPATEDDSCSPETVYGLSKLMSERVLFESAATSGLNFVILRPAMVFGPGAPGNFARLIRLVDFPVFPQFGTISPLKSLAPVECVVDVMLAVGASQEIRSGEIFNVGGGEALTLREIAQCIARARGKRLATLRLPVYPISVASRALESVLSRVWPSAPSLPQLLKTFTSDAVINDGKVTRALGVRYGSIRDAIRDAAIRR
jgi:nucleoside-diphosphate-sugar epimerase